METDSDLIELHESKDEYDEPTLFNVIELIALLLALSIVIAGAAYAAGLLK